MAWPKHVRRSSRGRTQRSAEEVESECHVQIQDTGISLRVFSFEVHTCVHFFCNCRLIFLITYEVLVLCEEETDALPKSEALVMISVVTKMKPHTYCAAGVQLTSLL